ncbi:uncharacterized protein LOC115729112 [Rhodamnia argentea]|uniref:Uncharacterized protein LOC115729112 n=1 Tax=Rhodamnia argentea TaxID=178133 RepID=A0ABM3GTD7_9MYRT|nr:uncharacterized protein LOC115729112 [Rhodamnia argentea]XP_048127607.1 uncharacterized protein LOC115729112 [Rhodamnia argentea]XP_048127608.1 uncharacterized protein LOC115729112 [Rhodamnia argentea]XP_048127609.1 uncharacterized protein LOC115729112 [Rhodamnia argentea]XP_048127610.1 uncharacterized protein LOC115729112 [Rhodamnia argentea]
MALPRNPQQLESKQGQSGQIQSVISGSLIKSLTVLDEFKYGFPSNGLSVASNKWWGSGSLGDFDYIHATETGRECRTKCKDVADDGSSDEKKPEGEKENRDSTLQGSSLLMAVRKRALDEGREALKLGVFRSHHARKIGKTEKSLMLNIFQSSLPKGWMDD